MSSYDERINQFAGGKQLVRMARPIRDRADALCDACGSAQPRTLYVLQEQASDRYYFVGDTCLKELARRGAILKRYGRASGQQAYEEEMLRRNGRTSTVEERGGTDHRPERQGPGADPADYASPLDNPAPNSTGPSPFSFVLVVQAPDRYEALVGSPSSQKDTMVWGHAEEARYAETWRALPEHGFLLEQVKEERKDAFALCVQRALSQAVMRAKGIRLTDTMEQEASEEVPDVPLGLLLLPLAGLVMGSLPSSGVTSTNGPHKS